MTQSKLNSASAAAWLDATFQQAEALRQSGRPAEAIDLLQRALAEAPCDYRLHYELGAALAELRRHEQALGSFLTVLRLNPDCFEACVAVGYSYAARTMFEPAIQWFERARQMSPRNTTFLRAYARAFAALGCLKRAEDIANEWIQLEPDNPTARRLAAEAAGSSESTKTPADYIRQHFNDYAPHFDKSLAALRYCGPQLVVDALRRAKPTATEMDVLDLGCGTGLVGLEVRSLARRLTGVDLSAAMLELARSRNAYDQLVEADVVDYLQRCPSTFDAVIAADVLTYIGDLSQFFRGAATALRRNGVVVVAIEELPGQRDFQLNPTGRFSHGLRYLRNVMDDAGLTATVERDVMRFEAEQPVATLVAAGIRQCR